MLYLTAVIFVIILYAAIVISCILNANKNNKHLTEQQQADADARIKAYLDFTTHIII